MARTARQRARLWMHMAYAVVAGDWITRRYVTATSVVSTTNQYTFSSVNFGEAYPRRHIIVGVCYRATGSVTIDSVTIGGVTATLNATATNTTSGNSSVSTLAVAHIPTGISGDVVINLSGNAVRAGIAVWNANLPSTTANDTATAATGGAEADFTVTIDKCANGAVFAMDFNSDQTGGSTFQGFSAASKESKTTRADQTITVTHTDGVTVWTGITKDSDTVISTGTSAPQALSVASWTAR